MFSKTVCAIVAALLLAGATARAEPGRFAQPQTHQRSAAKRVLWTAIGAGAGFAAGLMIGLDKFDDAINSDRKVWTSALVGAAAGGLAGALLSRDVASTPPWTPVHTRNLGAKPAQGPSHLFQDPSDDSALLARVRRVSN